MKEDKEGRDVLERYHIWMKIRSLRRKLTEGKKRYRLFCSPKRMQHGKQDDLESKSHV